MHFWIFPLVGGCFLSLLIFNNEINSVKTVPYSGKNKIPCTIQDQISYDSEWVELPPASKQAIQDRGRVFNKTTQSMFNYKNLWIPQDMTEFKNPKTLYSAYYPIKRPNFYNKTSSHYLSTEIENLCLFYLNLTTQKLQTSSYNLVFSKKSDIVLQKNLAETSYFQNKASFNWTWHSVKMSQNYFLNSFSRPELAQKLSNENLNSNLKQNVSFLSFSKQQFNNIPHLSYYQGTILLDQWLKVLDYNSAIKKTEKNDVSTILINILPKSFEKIKTLEILLSNGSKIQNGLFFHFFDLLQMLTKNKTNLKQIYSSPTFNSLTKETIKNSGLANLVLLKNKSEKVLSTNLLKKIQTQYRYGLLQILVQNSLQTTNQKNLGTKEIKPMFSDQRFKKILKYTVFLKSIKQTSLLRNKTKPILKKLQSLAILNQVNNALDLKAKETVLKTQTYELFLWQSWQKIFAKLDYSLYVETAKTLTQTPILQQPLNVLNNTETNFNFNKIQPENVPKVTKKIHKLVEEMNLYQRLNKISQKLLIVSYSLQGKNLNLLHQRPNTKIVKYATPILMTKSPQTNFTFLSKDSKKSALDEIQQSKLTRKGEPWFEIASKQTNFGSTFFFYKKPFLPLFKSETNKHKETSSFNISFYTKILKDGNIQNLGFFKDIPFSFFENYLIKSPLNEKPAKTFSLVKSLKTLREQKVFLLKPNKILNIGNSQNSLKYFKLKNKKIFHLSNSVIEKRKAERIFRTYFSIKFLENNEKNVFNKTNKFYVSSQKVNKKSVSLQSILPILEKIKTTVKLKKILSKQRQKVHFFNVAKNSYRLSNQKQNFFSKKAIQTVVNPFTLNVYKKKSNPVKKSLAKTLLKKVGGNLLFLKKSDFTLNKIEIKRLERKKTLQKKRRLKKLKLENRRRKKRKRFYPRPTHLRFHLYYSFLQKRHPQESKPILHKIQYSNLITTKTTIKSLRVPKKLNAKLFKEKIYRQQNQKWGNVTSNLVGSEKFQLKKFPLNWTVPTYHQQEFYKIPNETLTEFERLCWKSYWLRSNITPYIRRIQQNLKKMQEKENTKSGQKTFSTILENLLIWPIYRNSYFLPSKAFFFSKQPQSAPAYLNIKETLNNSFLKNETLTNFKQLENKAEYNRLIYERITDEIKNVKSQLNVDGQNHARSYKVGRQKIEKPVAKNLWSSLNSWTQSFLEPRVQSFAIFAATQDPSIKPFGDLPTLRLLWACQKTNLFTYHPNNLAKNVWSTYKNREQTKNNKTKKFVSKIFKLYNISPKNFETMSLNKTKLAYKKIDFFGGLSYGKNYNTYLRNLKYSLQNLKSKKCNLIQNLEILPQSKSPTLKNGKKIEKNFQIQKKNWFDTNLGQKPQKQMVHFWWSTQQVNPIEQIFSLWISSPFVFNDLNFYIRENTNLIFEQMSASSVSKTETSNLSEINLQFNKNIILTTFWVSCLLFHVSCLFAVIRIPEIRSLAKFQFLLLSKLTNAYLMGLFAIYNLLVNYKTKIQCLIQKIGNFSKLEFNMDNPWIESFNLAKKIPDTSNSNELFPGDWSSKKLKLSKNLLNFQSLQSTRKFTKAFIQTNMSKALSKHFFKPLIYSTMGLKFEFRPFMDFSSKVENNSKALTERVKKTSSLKAVLLYSLNPSSSKLNLKHKQKASESQNSSNWLTSWYTGFLWYSFSKSFQSQTLIQNQSLVSMFYSKKQTYLKENLKKSSMSLDNITKIHKAKTLKTTKQKFSTFVESNIQIQSVLSLFTLYLSKLFVNIFYLCFNVFYKFIFKLIDIMEGILMIFYKFLEKPAELMVDWIAEIFLIEWSSDLTTYIPEAFDTSIWNAITKFSRSTRPFGGFVFGFLTQKLFLSSLEIFYSWILKPDTDLMIRQKKGIIFWDIWAEILIQAAEKYKMNLSSLTTLKEEQELLIENLLEDNSASLATNSLNSLQSPKSKVKQTNFLNSETLQLSLTKMTPLMRFLQTSPTNPNLAVTYSSVLNIEKLKNNPYEFFNSNVLLSNLSSLKIENEPYGSFQQKTTGIDSWKRWSVNQSLTTQGRDTDLFMDVHPPKSFLNISFLKTYLPAQEILGSLVCDIYSGLFSQKVSKNILVVGAPGTAKSFFIQALAGETELKIVTDNAYRYAFVQGGVPVGMKLLRDVFDSIALHTPCLFLLEDIHIIGERRPMLISDDENSKANDTVFGAEQEEVHEKNRLIYQLSRHSISHYKRPYKGDFSLSIPTNRFSYDLFLGISPPRKRRLGLTTKSPLPLAQLEKTLTTSEPSTANNEESNSFSENKLGKSQQSLLSLLQVSTEQVFAPPATSPFTILLMKEQKKLKPRKFVKEMPWSGLSYDQYMLISKSHYSVRVKVTLLAEMAMTNLSVKLDMITDLLVIIDSVRSNRGFVVFATTHVPSLLDPALRRPGRLDETISLPLLPNLMSRFEIFKTSLSSYSEAIDLFDYSLLTSAVPQNENQIYAAISKSLLLLLNTKYSKKFHLYNNLYKPSIFPNSFNDYPIYSISQAFQTSMNLNSALINTSQLQKCVTQASKLQIKNKTLTLENKQENVRNLHLRKSNLGQLLQGQSFNIVLSGNDKLNYISLTFAQAGQFLVEALLLKDHTTYFCKFLTSYTKNQEAYNTEEQIFKTLYSSSVESKNTLLKLFAGKISEFFVLNTCYSQKYIILNFLFNSVSPNQIKTNSKPLIETFVSNEKTSLTTKKDWWLTQTSLLNTNPSQSVLFENIQNYQTYWQSATSFLQSLYQKRFLYNKNTVVSKMLFFEDGSSLRGPPSPPNSSILMPAKKFENYKRTLKDFIHKPMLNINEKLQLHQKQRFLKLLYNISVQTSFQTVSTTTNFVNNLSKLQPTTFYNSFKELGYLDLLTLKSTSTSCFYKNRYLTRHRFSFLNQWWNGQLAEHNVETTYLSHVDWRSMFVQSLGDLVIDFPDAEQYYNPRLRRWFLQSTSWNYWLSFEKNLKHEILEYSILYSFTKTSTLLNLNRELFDSLAYRFLRYHQVKEIDLLDILIRFYKNEEVLFS